MSPSTAVSHQLVPASQASLQPGHLCYHCKECVKCCGIFVPSDLLGSRSDAMMGLDYRGSPSTHSSYSSFAASLQEGCFVCNTLLRNNTKGMPVSIPISYWEKDDADITTFDASTDGRSDILTFSLKLPPSDDGESPEISRQHFILESAHGGANKNLPIEHVPAGSTNSEASWSFMLEKLTDCCQSHETCGSSQDAHPQSSSSTWYPTRLLYVGTGETTAVRIVETRHSVLEGPYVTLSHCWGDPAAIVKLTTSNLASFSEQVPQPLPATFEHAILATRKLGARYIWIDCLCILQDDPLDWERESKEMAKVYGNGLCNIAASASKNPEEGLFRDRDDILPGIFLKGEYSDYGPNRPLLLVKRDHVSEHDGDDAPLQKRGWVLQERLLSPRVIHFSHRQIVWECNKLVASESFPHGVPRTWGTQKIAKRLDISLEVHSDYEDEILEVWGDILKRYTAMNLTYRSDLLPALSGVAKHIGGLTGTEYLAGIWKRPGAGFSAHLGWKCTDPRLRCLVPERTTTSSATGKGWTWLLEHTRSTVFSVSSGLQTYFLSWIPPSWAPPRQVEQYRAPTWSWASTDNSVTLDPMESPDEDKRRSYFANVRSGARILDAQVTPATLDPTGSVSSGFILAEGPLNELGVGLYLADQWYMPSNQMEIFWDGTEHMASKATKYTFPLYTTPVFDTWDEMGDDYDVFVYLILTPSLSQEQPNSYIRCGIGRTWHHCSDTGDLEPPDTWIKVVHAPDAPCEEFLGAEVGHRIRII